jgi:hypothetical protein
MTRSKIVAVSLALLALAAGTTSAFQMQMEMTGMDGPAATVEDTGSELIITTAGVPLPVMAMEEGGEHGGHDGTFPPVATLEIPVHAYLRGFDYEVIDGDGNVLSPQILHHFNIIDPDHKELFLPISQRLLAAGMETGGQTMPRLLFGVPVYVGQRMVLTTMLHNPTGVAHDEVSLRIKLKYTPVGRPWPLWEVYPYQIDVAFPAGDKSFDLPPGKSSKSWEGSPSQEGKLIVVGSHLHELATHITLENVTTGETIWTGYPVTDEEGNLGGVTIGHLYRKLGVKIFTDNVYRATVYYDNTTGNTLAEGGMGVVAGVFMPTKGGPWPRADVSNPLYALDSQHYMRQVRGNYDVISEGGGIVVEGEDHGAHATPQAADTAHTGHD